MIQWLLFTLLAILIQGLFALFEMACVSFNKIRLQYYVSKRDKRAIWINYLLGRPSRLFGTTLLGINTALQVGSECSRRFYESIHIDPDWAPLSQVIIVVIFGELVPMFAARKHPERIAMFFAPLMIMLAKCFIPLTWTFDQLSKLLHRAMNKSDEPAMFLSREEVMFAFQEGDRGEDEFTAIAGSIFQLKSLTAGALMHELKQTLLFPSTSTVGQVRSQLEGQYAPILPIYHRSPYNVVSIVSPRDLLLLPDDHKIISKGKSPWFVTRDTSILQLLDQFRRNNQSVAVILEPSGQASGILTLDQIIDAIFGREEKNQIEEIDQDHFISRTLKGSMTIAQFNAEFALDLAGDPNATLSDHIISYLDHPPSLGESIRLGNYEFTIKEPTIRGIKTLTVQTQE
jgi:CBS domain containing-hemolysin-like protein